MFLEFNLTTTLEVLNHMLNVIGETPVTSAQSNHPSDLSAMVQLNRVNKEFQSRGWWFNTEYGLKLIPNESGEIIIPSGTLYVDPVDSQSKLTRRGGKLYDPVQHTFLINRPVFVTVILKLDVEDLPETAALYLMHKAAYDFYVNDDGDETKSNRLEKQVDKAWANLQSEELRVSNVNAMDRPTTAHLRLRTRQYGLQYNPKWPGGRA